MAISRSLMNRQLQANGGIMQVAPREKFGLGSKLKSFVRKIIPNEIADIAVKAAPFVAPFNPAVGAAMSGLGRFDQTGSIGDSLKGGALTYGLGQGARYLGGAGFQGNPFAADGGAFRGGFEGFTQGFSSPLGTDTGLGKFFSNRGTDAVQGINSGRGGDSASALSRSTANAPTEALASEVSYVPNATEALASEVSLVPQAKPDQGFFSSIVEKFQNKDYSGLGREVLDKAKEGGKALFTKPVPGQPGKTQLDKAAVLGAATFAASYAEAKALANDAGVEITEEQYDEAKKADKKEEYAGYLTNFFAGKKDGGRIGYELGANKYITKRERQNPMAGLGLLGGLDPTIDESDQKIILIMTENGPQMMTESEFNEQMGVKNGTESIVIDMMNFGDEKKPRIIDLGKKDGGRIGFKLGTPKDTTMFEKLNVDTIYRPEPESTITLPEKMLDNDNRMPGNDRMVGVDGDGFDEDADNIRGLAEIYMQEGMSESEAYEKAVGEIYEIDMSKFKKGGRVNRKFGSPEKGEKSGVMEMLAVDVDAGGDDEEENMMMAYEPGNFTNVQKSYMYRRLAAMGGKDRSITMPDLYKIFKNPGKYPADELVIKSILDANGLKDGGRIGYKGGANRVSELLILRDEKIGKGEDVSDIEAEIFQLTGKTFKSVGGISDVPTGQIRKNNAGVVERDYRDEGGFVPVGIKERADDVPAMLSKNEFVMTADAVRGIGNGSVEEGSKKLYNTMKQAEKVGKA